jgi:hypothetical protein
MDCTIRSIRVMQTFRPSHPVQLIGSLEERKLGEINKIA